MIIRPARRSEAPVLQRIEVSAGAAFATVGMQEIAADAPPSVATFAQHCARGDVWVCADESDTPQAFVLTEIIDSCLHIEQISVHSNHSGKRLGARLIDHLVGQANAQGLLALTLTTFRDVPWNAPYYARLGFDVIDDEELTPGLRTIRGEEAKLGLDRWPRVGMKRNL